MEEFDNLMKKIDDALMVIENNLQDTIKIIDSIKEALKVDTPTPIQKSESQFVGLFNIQPSKHSREEYLII